MLLQCLAHNAAHICGDVNSREIERHNYYCLPLGPTAPKT